MSEPKKPMSVEDILAELPRLRTEYETLRAQKDDLDKDLEPIEEKIADIKHEMQKAEADVKHYKKGSAEYKKAMAEKKKLKTELETQKKAKNQLLKKDGNKDLAKKVEDARKELNTLVETLAQDPTINTILQEQIKFEFAEKIGAQKEIVDGENKKSQDIIGKLQDKKLKAELISCAKSYEASKFKNPDKDDPSYKRIKDAFANKLRTELGLSKKDLSDADIKAIVEASIIREDGKKPRFEVPKELKLSTSARRIASAEKMMQSLREDRDKTLASLESQKGKNGSVSDRTQIESNKKEIEKIDEEIAVDEAEGGDKYTDFKAKRDKLTRNKVVPYYLRHIVNEDRDENDEEELTESEEKILGKMSPEEKEKIAKTFKEFSDKSKAVREAFAKCKTGDISKEDFDKIISEYKSISEQLEGITGFDAESWQYVLNEQLNDHFDYDGITPEEEDIFYHQENRALNALGRDKRVKDDPELSKKCSELYEATTDLDEAQDKILNGEIPDDLSDTFQKYGDSLEKFKGTPINIKGILGKRELVKFGGLRGIWNTIKNKVSNILPKRTPKDRVYLNEGGATLTPDGIDRIVDEYEEAIAGSDEMQRHTRIEELKHRKEELVQENAELEKTAVKPEEMTISQEGIEETTRANAKQLSSAYQPAMQDKAKDDDGDER